MDHQTFALRLIGVVVLMLSSITAVIITAQRPAPSAIASSPQTADTVAVSHNHD
jgi:hypothetical protein